MHAEVKSLIEFYPFCQVWQQVPLLLLSHFANPTNSFNFVDRFLFSWIDVPYFLPYNYQRYAYFLCYMMDFRSSLFSHSSEEI